MNNLFATLLVGPFVLAACLLAFRAMGITTQCRRARRMEDW